MLTHSYKKKKYRRFRFLRIKRERIQFLSVRSGHWGNRLNKK